MSLLINVSFLHMSDLAIDSIANCNWS